MEGSTKMHPAAKPSDLESNSQSNTFKSLHHHRDAVLPAPGPTQELSSAGQQRQQMQRTRRAASWVLGGCVFLLVAAAAVITPDRSTTQLISSLIPLQLQERAGRMLLQSATPHYTPSNNTPARMTQERDGQGALVPEQLTDEAGASFVPCQGPELQCGVVNKQPIPEADFRNLPRRATSKRGMVLADNSRCSTIGRNVLQDGGNAVDAAVATALCEGVISPMSTGLGGGAFITVRLANGTDAFWDARETAPAAATADMFFSGKSSDEGGLAVAVPGELQGLEAAWKRFGSKPWAQLVKPAADLARTGFAAHPYIVVIINSHFQSINSVKALREAFLINDPQQGWRVPRVGELCCQRPKLAETLDKIAASGGSSYLSSPAVTSAHAAELKAAGGIITASDLAAAAPQERELLRMQLGELELLLPPPPSSAAVVGFMLKFLAGYGNTLIQSSNSSGRATEGPLPSFGASDPHRDNTLGMHRLLESMKHGFAVRTALGDPGSPQQPFPEAASIQAAVGDLLSDGFVDALRAKTQDDDVLPDNQYGGRWNPRGVRRNEEHGTSHVSVVDAQRNAVSLTSSINGPFGSLVVSDTTGILFGNTMDDFATSRPSKTNYVAPGRRPLSAMSPIIVTHKASGRLVAVAGATGGPMIVSATAQTLARLLLEGADIEAAVSAPRMHNSFSGSGTSIENFVFGSTTHQMPQFVVNQLVARHQAMRPRGAASLGVAQAIVMQYENAEDDRGVLVAAGDSRKDIAPVAEE